MTDGTSDTRSSEMDRLREEERKEADSWQEGRPWRNGDIEETEVPKGSSGDAQTDLPDPPGPEGGNDDRAAVEADAVDGDTVEVEAGEGEDDRAREELDDLRRRLAGEADIWQEGRPWRKRDIEETEVPKGSSGDAQTDLPDPPDPALDDHYLKVVQGGDLQAIGRWLLGNQAGKGGPLAPIEQEALLREDADSSSIRRDLPVDIDPHDLREARWGIVAPQRLFSRLRRQLAPLLELRREQMGLEAPIEPLVYLPGESAPSFLVRHGETIGTIDPEKVPYYLLILGGPEEVPFEFQYQLAVNHAVGRLAFDDPAAYGDYAAAVVAAEKEGSRLPHRATIFSVENEGDEVAPFLANFLTQPLHRELAGYLPGWEVELARGEQATKEGLRRLLSGNGASPGLLLTSCHGQALPAETFKHTVQRRYQGALMCQKVEGQKDRRFAGEDIPGDADLRGLIAFLFACYGAGTPVLDNFPDPRKPETAVRQVPGVLSDMPFVAELPQQLLRRGALGVVGHVDRGWALSFVWTVGRRNLSSVSSLEDSLKRLMLGDRVGHALRPLHRRAAALAERLARVLERSRWGIEVDLCHLAELWISYNDARNFVLLGDPAAYLLGRRSMGDLVRLPAELTERLGSWAAGQGLDLESAAARAVEEWLGGERVAEA